MTTPLQAWNALADVTRTDALDGIIEAFPDSPDAGCAMNLRMRMLRGTRNIVDWYAFIEKHKQRPAAEVALQEVYGLCCVEDKLPGYLELARRYPRSPQGQAAALKAQGMALELALHLERVGQDGGGLGWFVRRFAGSALAMPALRLGPQVAVAAEWERIEKHRDKGKAWRVLWTTKYKRSKREMGDFYAGRANQLACEWGDLMFDKMLLPDGHPLHATYLVQMECRRRVLTRVYPEQDAARSVLMAALLERVVDATKDVQETLDKHHKQSMELLAEGFSESWALTIRETNRLVAAIAGAGQDVVQAVQAADAAVQERLDAVDASLKTANETLAKVDMTTAGLKGKVNQVVGLLEGIDGRIAAHAKAVCEAHKAIDGKIGALPEAVAAAVQPKIEAAMAQLTVAFRTGLGDLGEKLDRLKAMGDEDKRDLLQQGRMVVHALTLLSHLMGEHDELLAAMPTMQVNLAEVLRILQPEGPMTDTDADDADADDDDAHGTGVLNLPGAATNPNVEVELTHVAGGFLGNFESAASTLNIDLQAMRSGTSPVPPGVEQAQLVALSKLCDKLVKVERKLALADARRLLGKLGQGDDDKLAAFLAERVV